MVVQFFRKTCKSFALTMEYLLKLAFFLWIFLLSVHPAKIIIFQPLVTKSHKNAIRPLVHELASRGHELTWVSCFPEDKLVPNLKEIVIAETAPLISGTEHQKLIFETALNKDKWSHLKSMFSVMKKSTENFLNHPEIESLMKKGMQFDLAIVNSFMKDIGLMISPDIAKQIVSFSPIVFGTVSKSSPPFPVSAIAIRECSDDMTFFERLINAGMWNIMHFVFPYMSITVTNTVGREKYPNLNVVTEAANKIALSFVNADPVLSSARPGISSYIDIGGIHCKPPKPLQKEFADFIESSGDDGFIFFSLGSLVQAKYMPEKIRLEFLKAFSSLKQKVIWKFEEQMSNVSSNVMITPWAPQQDLLGHPKIRLFFTHGGLLSSQEAIYHGVPVLGVAVFADQPLNIYRLTERGVAVALDITNLSAEIIKTSIEKIIQDPRYENNMKKYSAIFRDQPQHPLERAVFWIEHLLRHGNVDHLITSAVYLDGYQYLALDVISAAFIVFIFLLWLTIRITKLVINRISRRKCIENK